MKLNFELSELALSDVDSIWEHTLATWSKQQANKYYKDIFKGIEPICKNPEIEIAIEELKTNHRILKIKSHLIIYKNLDNVIYIDRVLHQRMDIENQLDQ